MRGHFGQAGGESKVSASPRFRTGHFDEVLEAHFHENVLDNSKVFRYLLLQRIRYHCGSCGEDLHFASGAWTLISKGREEGTQVAGPDLMGNAS